MNIYQVSYIFLSVLLRNKYYSTTEKMTLALLMMIELQPDIKISRS